MKKVKGAISKGLLKLIKWLEVSTSSLEKAFINQVSIFLVCLLCKLAITMYEFILSFVNLKHKPKSMLVAHALLIINLFFLLCYIFIILLYILSFIYMMQVSHRINRLSFGDHYDGLVNPLDG